MKQYRKKPVVINALQFDGKNWEAIGEFVGQQAECRGKEVLVIKTLEGDMLANVGDWIIKGVKGEFYPCKPDIFAATYDIENNANKPTDNAGQVTEGELKKFLLKKFPTNEYMDCPVPKHHWETICEFATLVAEERCREKEALIQQLETDYAMDIGRLKEQLEIRDKQLEEERSWRNVLLQLTAPWPLKDVLAILAYATDILLKDKGHDGPKYEEMQHCSELAKNILIPGLEAYQAIALTAHQEQKQGGNNEA
jgi:hypothetical protein